MLDNQSKNSNYGDPHDKNSQFTNKFAPYLKHKGETPEEQLRLNQPALALLKKWLEEEITESETIARERQWEMFKETIDSFRPQGHKLYSE